MTGTPEPTLADVAAMFPHWTVWRGVNGLLYARLPGSSPPLTARGEDARDLIDEVRGLIGRASEGGGPCRG
jgi:hypothetical protein